MPVDFRVDHVWPFSTMTKRVGGQEPATSTPLTPSWGRLAAGVAAAAATVALAGLGVCSWRYLTQVRAVDSDPPIERVDDAEDETDGDEDENAGQTIPPSPTFQQNTAPVTRERLEAQLPERRFVVYQKPPRMWEAILCGPSTAPTTLIFSASNYTQQQPALIRPLSVQKATLVCAGSEIKGSSVLTQGEDKRDCGVMCETMPPVGNCGYTASSSVVVNSNNVSPDLRLACVPGHRNSTTTNILRNPGASVRAQGSKEEGTRLHVAARNGCAEVVRSLLDTGAIPGARIKSTGEAPIHIAASGGHLEVVELLLPRLTLRQVNMTSKGEHGTTPLINAVEGLHANVVHALLKAGADPNEARLADGRSPLSIVAGNASSGRSVATMRSLLQAGADPQLFCHTGLLPLHRACRGTGDMEMVKLLLAAGTPVNALAPGMDFLTPLHFAARSGHAEAARALLSVSGCELEKKEDRSGTSPLESAVCSGHVATVRVLLEAGAKMEGDVRDKDGVSMGSLAHVAEAKGHSEILHLLLDARASIEVAKVEKTRSSDSSIHRRRASTNRSIAA